MSSSCVAAGSPRFPAEMRDTAALMLRLTDLGTGYTIGDDTGCGIGTENAPDNLAQAVIAHLPESCSIEFQRFLLSPYVESTALTCSPARCPAARWWESQRRATAATSAFSSCARMAARLPLGCGVPTAQCDRGWGNCA